MHVHSSALEARSTAQEGVIERFSKYDRLAHPGLVWINCCCCETLHVLDLKVRQLEVKVETKTKDNVFVNMKIVVQFKVSDTYKAFYTLAQPDDQIRAHVCDVVRGQVPKTTLDGVFEVKDEIAREVKEALAKVMSEAGYMILTVLVIDIDPDPEVKRSMNAINANQRLRIAAVEKGEADKILQVKSAEAEAERKYLEGAGVARQRKAIMDGLRESVAAFTDSIPGADAKAVLDMMVIFQHFDMMREIGIHGKSSAVFVPYGPGAVHSMADQIRQGILEGNFGNAAVMRGPGGQAMGGGSAHAGHGGQGGNPFHGTASMSGAILPGQAM
eukprot:tig00000441_g708.t1